MLLILAQKGHAWKSEVLRRTEPADNLRHTRKRRWRARTPKPGGRAAASLSAKRLAVRNGVPLWDRTAATDFSGKDESMRRAGLAFADWIGLFHIRTLIIQTKAI